LISVGITFSESFIIAGMNINRTTNSTLSSIDFSKLEFGKVFSDHMLVCDFDGTSWGEFSIEPLQPILMHPGTSVLHYGQAIFEGLKAYKNHKGQVNIFRLKDNMARFNESAKRMKMPTLDLKAVIEATKQFVNLERDFIPSREEGSLYLRPFMIGTDHTLKAISSNAFRFMIIACPVGFYYNKPLNIFLEQTHRRAARGGVGFAKAAGNYAASFYPTELAKNKGFDQILWTDITTDYNLEELGSANFFYFKDRVLHTPEIHDSILKGITRDSVIELARARDIVVEEGSTSAAMFRDDLAQGRITCMFATGTAAAITYVNSITIADDKFEVKSDLYSPVLQLKDDLEAAKFLDNFIHSEWNVVLD
jgi:branched-chain amino acid aminotransferase